MSLRNTPRTRAGKTTAERIVLAAAFLTALILLAIPFADSSARTSSDSAVPSDSTPGIVTEQAR